MLRTQIFSTLSGCIIVCVHFAIYHVHFILKNLPFHFPATFFIHPVFQFLPKPFSYYKRTFALVKHRLSFSLLEKWKRETELCALFLLSSSNFHYSFVWCQWYIALNSFCFLVNEDTYILGIYLRKYSSLHSFYFYVFENSKLHCARDM